mmetsp:Transcript_26827/g.59280  ORF Transcript_26827/g.59280 Transcript_26827/m.59280 type:complete len:204 (-) Transcript_26827:391-1002(-)
MELGANKIPARAVAHEIVASHRRDVGVQLKIQNTARGYKSRVALLFPLSHSVIPLLPHLLRRQHFHLIHNLVWRHSTRETCGRCVGSKHLMAPLLRSRLRLRWRLRIAVRPSLGVSLSSESALSLHLHPPYRNLLEDFASGVGHSDVVLQRIRFFLFASINALLDLLLLTPFHVVKLVNHHLAKISWVLDSDQVRGHERLLRH